MQPERRREVVTWDEVDRLIDHLIPQFRREYTAMVIITRGGIVPGGLLADAMNITHILTAAVDFPAQSESQKSKMMAWPEFIQFPADDKLSGRPTLIVDDVWGSGRTITAVKNRVSAAADSPKRASCISIRIEIYSALSALIIMPQSRMPSSSIRGRSTAAWIK